MFGPYLYGGGGQTGQGSSVGRDSHVLAPLGQAVPCWCLVPWGGGRVLSVLGPGELAPRKTEARRVSGYAGGPLV